MIPPSTTKPKPYIRQVSNPATPYGDFSLDWLELPPMPKLQIFEEHAKSIVSTNNSPDIGFSHSVNPYRGCHHGCAYCYARPSHQYLDFGAGTDFERKIVVKVNAPELLEKEFMKRSWKGEPIIFSGNTDCYQPLEGHYQLTRRLLEVCLKFKNPVTIITKGVLIRRDLELLRELDAVTSLHVAISLAFLDDEMCRAIEPYTPLPSARLRVIAELAAAGIHVGIGVAPIIPGLNDTQIAELLNRASAAGAQSAFRTLLRLPAEVKDVFIERLTAAYPTRAEKVLNGTRRMKNGELNRSTFGKRMSGEGKEWEALQWLFDSTCERLGLNHRRSGDFDRSQRSKLNSFTRPTAQLSLFE